MKIDRLIAQARIETPLGPLTLAATQAGLAGAWFDAQKHHPGVLPAAVDAHQRWIAQAARQLAAYFDCRLERFDLALDLQGTPLQQAVWRALLQIPKGATRSYGELARSVGAQRAVRAVGAAVGRNPLSIVVPCHRVLAADGSLTGYAGGLERKRALLELEGAMRSAQQSMRKRQEPPPHAPARFIRVAT